MGNILRSAIITAALWPVVLVGGAILDKYTSGWDVDWDHRLSSGVPLLTL
jgi:hypothetical protein